MWICSSERWLSSRRGPVRLDPFIEAEEPAGRSVRHCCDKFAVSRAAYYPRQTNVPSDREISDVEMIEQIRQIHDDSDGTYGAPRVHNELGHRGVDCGRRWGTPLMRAHGLEGRCKKRWRKTTIADPTATAEALDLIERHSGPSEVHGVRLDRGLLQHAPSPPLPRATSALSQYEALIHQKAISQAA